MNGDKLCPAGARSAHNVTASKTLPSAGLSGICAFRIDKPIPIPPARQHKPSCSSSSTRSSRPAYSRSVAATAARFFLSPWSAHLLHIHAAAQLL